MAHWLQRLLLTTVCVLTSTLTGAFSVSVWAASPEVISPDLDRREVKIARIDNENIELGLYAGILSIEDFDSSEFVTFRANFHINEHLFIEGSYGWAKGDKTSFEEIFTSTQLVSDNDRDYTTYDVSIGWNIFPGESWIFNKAFKSDFYIIFGAGSTDFGGDKWFTINTGVGYRLFLTDWMSWRIDVRDHIFNRDIFGEDDRTNNIELSSGLSFFF